MQMSTLVHVVRPLNVYNDILNVRTRQTGSNRCILTAVVPLSHSVHGKDNLVGFQSSHSRAILLYLAKALLLLLQAPVQLP